MTFRTINEDERERVRNFCHSGGQIKRKATVIVDTLAGLFGAEGDLAQHALKFTPDPQEQCLALVSSPTGSGRLIFRHVQLGDELYGEIAVERQGHDYSGRTAWSLVWAFNFQAGGAAFVDANGKRDTFDIEARFGQHRETAYFLIGMNIIYALVAGPLV